MPGGTRKLMNYNSQLIKILQKDSSLQSNTAMLLRQLEMRKGHTFSQRHQQLCLGGGNISATYSSAQQLLEKKHLR